MDVCYGDCGGPVDGQEVIINRAYLITAKIWEREREILYIYASYSSYRADSIWFLISKIKSCHFYKTSHILVYIFDDKKLQL